MGRRVTFLPHDVRISAAEGETIAQSAERAGVTVESPCGGQGRCGRCKVSVTGRTGEKGRESLSKEEWDAGVRLACQAEVLEDISVMVGQPTFHDIEAVIDHSPLRELPLSPMAGGRGHGLALDIGTTTVAASLLELRDGAELMSLSDYNHQLLLGEDVLSRMEHAEDEGPEGLRALALRSVNGILARMGDLIDIEVRAVSVAANTVMGHLFLGVDPSPLRNPPFKPLIEEGRHDARGCGLEVEEGAELLMLPCLSSYVGGDVVADILHSGMHRDRRVTLLIDVGTNGELVLGNDEFMVACSSSAGPAFEGGELRCGTRACPGAVESVRAERGGFRMATIGGEEAHGFCGSGLIDLLAQLLISGLVDKKGRFTRREAVEDDEGDLRLHLGPGRRELSISEGEIQSIIRTKAAIFAAARSLLSNLGMEFSDLERVLIAGGFGRHIDLENAIAIGLLPDIARERFQFLGNAALGGAKSALLHGDTRDELGPLVKRMTYLDLGSDPSFFHEYSSALFLPHTDQALFPSRRD